MGWSSADNALLVEEVQDRYTSKAGKYLANKCDVQAGLEVFRNVYFQVWPTTPSATLLAGLNPNVTLDGFYTREDAARSYRQLLEGIVQILPWIATVDAFQHWIYSHPDHTQAERRQSWTALLDRFGGKVDWSGYEEGRAHYWHRQLHIFLYPFYYIEYGIAQLGALFVTGDQRARAKTEKTERGCRRCGDLDLR